MDCSEKVFLLLLPSISFLLPHIEPCPKPVCFLAEYVMFGHRILIFIADIVLLGVPLCYFSHAAPCFLAFSVLLCTELVFYFFLILSIPLYSSTVFYLLS